MAAWPPRHPRKGVGCKGLPPARIASWGGEGAVVSLTLRPPHPDGPPRRPVGHPCERGGWPGDPALGNLATAVRVSLLAPRCGRPSSFLPPCTGRETEAEADRPAGRAWCGWGVHLGSAPHPTCTRGLSRTRHRGGGAGKPPWRRWPRLHGDTESLLSRLRREATDRQWASRRSNHDTVLGLSPSGGRRGGRPGHTRQLVLLPTAFLLPERGLFPLLSSVEFLSA